jgi:hypothetical protein
LSRIEKRGRTKEADGEEKRRGEGENELTGDGGRSVWEEDGWEGGQAGDLRWWEGKFAIICRDLRTRV